MGYYNVHMRYINCIYYIRESEKEMTCQSAEEGILSAKKFESEAKKVEYQREHCRYNCKRCHDAEQIKKLFGN